MEQLIRARYRKDELLGRGGMGEVWRGFDITLERPIAIKTIVGAGLNEGFIKLFEREARMCARMQSKHVVAVHDFGRDEDGDLFLIMELLEGVSLEQVLKSGRIPLARAVNYAVQACRGLHTVHEMGVVHRDVKPSNLMVVTQDGAALVKVLDFGLAKQGAELGTQASRIAGTPNYMAPEQFKQGVIDRRADVYGVASVAWHLIVGRPAVRGDAASCMYQHLQDPPPALPAEACAPRALDEVLLKALAKNPDDRFATCGALADALERSLAAGSFVGSVDDTVLMDMPANQVFTNTGPLALGADVDALLPLVTTPSMVAPSSLLPMGTEPTMPSSLPPTAGPRVPRADQRSHAAIVGIGVAVVAAGVVAAVASVLALSSPEPVVVPPVRPVAVVPAVPPPVVEPPPPVEVPVVVPKKKTLTNAQALEPLKMVQEDLKACFKYELAANPAMPLQMTLGYSIELDGKPSDVVLVPALPGRPVVACVQRVVSSLRWPRSDERKHVKVPFKFTRPTATTTTTPQ
ncbi:MAG: protein kinase [Deltaproteobacteria bacterium]|nr:protein kinase [Deltaproteobacteria bacterium]